jgi:hypothetical protein
VSRLVRVYRPLSRFAFGLAFRSVSFFVVVLFCAVADSFQGSSKNTGVCWGSGAVASNHQHPFPAPPSTSPEWNGILTTAVIGESGMGRRNHQIPEPPGFHDKCDSSHSTAASSHESDPAHSDHSCHNSDEDSKRRMLVPPNEDALHHDDNNPYAGSGQKAMQPSQHLVKNSEARSERRLHQHNKTIHNDCDPDDDDGGGRRRDLPQHNPGNPPLRHDHRHQSCVQQIVSPPRSFHVSQNAKSQELQASGDRSMAADVLVRVSKPPSQHPFMEQQYTYQKEAYKFETPPLDDTLDDAEKERRRLALAQEQQQMILQQVHAAREANKKATSRASDKKSSPSFSYHAPSHNVIHNKRPAPTTSSSTRNANTPSANSTTTSRVATPAKSITLPPRHPILTKCPNPRTNGKLYRRLPDGTVVEALSNSQPRDACDVANETVSCEGILVLKEEVLEEEDTCSDDEREDSPIFEIGLAAEVTPKSPPSNAWHLGEFCMY